MSGIALAEEALGLAQTAPPAAVQLAESALRSGEAVGDSEAMALAERALGVAARAMDNLAEARAHLERAVKIAESSGLQARAGEARTSLSLVFCYSGDTTAALHQLELATPVLHGREAARMHMQYGLILQRAGRLEEALERYGTALQSSRRCGDSEGEARLLTNRGILHAYRGNYRAAESDLRQAERRHVELDQPLQAADVRHNLGFVAARRGDVPAALRWYDRAEQGWRELGVSRPVALLDRCEALMAVRLVAEARRIGDAAAKELEKSGMEADLAEARLLLSQAARLDGDTASAVHLATLAHAAFARQRRPGWAALARYARLKAVSEDPNRRCARSTLDQTAAALSDAGWVGPALDAQLIAARAALRDGRVDDAERTLAPTRRARSWLPADLRAQAWHAEAMLRRARGDDRGGERALLAGMRVLAQNRASLGATELRVHAAGHGQELGALSLAAALESNRADRVLAWSERWRAVTFLRTRPARPPADSHLADQLTRLRHLSSELEAAGFEGRNTEKLLHQQAQLENAIRRRTRQADGGTDTVVSGPPSVGVLQESLGDGALVELVASDGDLHAVTIVDGRPGLRRLGRLSEVDVEIDSLRASLARLARRNLSAPSASAAAMLAERAARRLDEILLAPLRPEIADRSLVIVPTGPLHALPWAALPSCRGRTVSVSPSAAVWLGAASRVAPRRALPTVLVAGPGVPYGDAEVARLARLYPKAIALRGADATAAGFRRAVAGAGLAHVAAHGRFRSDNPLFSSLRLADGPLTVYDLETLPTEPPPCLILSACDAGLSGVHPGDALMGFSSVLFAMGTQVIVASVVPVSDDVTHELMVRLHLRLARGATASGALAEAQAELSRDTGAPLASTGFVCFGGG